MTRIGHLEKRVRELQYECESYIQELAKKEHEIATLSAHIDELNLQLQLRSSLRAQARNLYNEVDDRIITKLSAKGAPISPPKKTHPPIDVKGVTRLEDLRGVAYMYDVTELFTYHRRESKPHLRQPYRTIAKLYRVGRDVSKRSVGVVLRIARRIK